MSAENLGLTEAISIALGGMIGGGIYAVLGVVTQITGAATWAAFVLAGVVATCAGYSYTKLNRLSEDRGGSVTFVQTFTGNTTLAGMAGWTLLVGYIGSMAMYAFAFAEFAIALDFVPGSVAGPVPLRAALSVLAVALFVGLNLLGARATGSTENVLVGVKVVVLVAFGIAGVAYALLGTPDPMRFGTATLVSFNPIMAAGVSFVAFQGWQLLFYDQESIAEPEVTIPKAVFVSIPVAVGIYVLVAVATFNLAPQAIQQHPHTALVQAARNILSVVGLAGLGGFIIAASALFSTGSAINATLFSSAHLAKGLLSKDLLPDQFGDGDADGIPEKTVVGLGAITAAFTAYGSLEAITSFASISFIVVFTATSYLAFRERDHDDIHGAIPAVGMVGAASFFPLMLYHLYQQDRSVFASVFVVGVVVTVAELLYFEHEALHEEVQEFADDVAAEFRG